MIRIGLDEAAVHRHVLALHQSRLYAAGDDLLKDLLKQIRFLESNLFQEIFEEIVARCVEAGLVKGEHMSVDGSFIQANADHHRRVPREQLAEIAKVNHTVREYLGRLGLSS